MSSVKREYSLPAPGITHVKVTSGNGTNNTLADYAHVYIDPRLSSVFRVDISDMSGTHSMFVCILLDTFTGAPGVVAGKEITILFSGNPAYYKLFIRFSPNMGPNIGSDNENAVYTYGDANGVPTAIKLMSDGTDFVVLSASDVSS